MYEVVEVTKPLRQRILARRATGALRRAAIEEETLTLLDSRVCKF